MADEIHFFSSSDANSPVLTGETGKLIDLLTACLVDGYTALSVTSITRSGSTATVTTGSAHGLVSDQWATIAGAVESDYNGRFKITVTSTTVFTYTVANSPSTPATGTITARRASAGWDKPYSGTNKAVYRSPNNASARHYLRVLDDGSTTGGAKEAALRGYVSMSDVDTGTEPFPTAAQASNGQYTPKSATANSTSRAWFLVADDKTFYLFINNGSTTIGGGFGHVNTWKPGDAYNSFIAFSVTANSQSAGSNGNAVTNGQGAHSSSVGVNAGAYMPRAMNQTGTAVNVYGFGQGNTTTGSASTAHGCGGAANCAFSFAGPSSNADGGLYVCPIYLVEVVGYGTNIIRGQLPGIYAPMHVQGSVAGTTISTGIAGLVGRSIYHADFNGVNTSGGGQTGQLCIDLTGPW